jgi:ABC-2 type transport system permease protein
MSATVSAPVVAVPWRPWSRTLAVYAKEAKYELIKQSRIPAYAIATIVFPVMFYVLFGIVLSRNSADRVQIATYAMATMGTFGVVAGALFGFGVSLAIERGQGWLEVKRASPMPMSAYFVAKLFSALAFSVAITSVLLIVAIAFGGVHLSTAMAAKLVLILVAGTIPFSAMGLAIGYLVKPNSAPGVINLIYLPMAFCSGLWIPLFMLPHGFRTIAKFLPPFHLGQLALNALGMGMDLTPAWGHVQALIGFTLVFLGLAWLAYRRDEGKNYG